MFWIAQWLTLLLLWAILSVAGSSTKAPLRKVLEQSRIFAMPTKMEDGEAKKFLSK